MSIHLTPDYIAELTSSALPPMLLAIEQGFASVESRTCELNRIPRRLRSGVEWSHSCGARIGIWNLVRRHVDESQLRGIERSLPGPLPVLYRAFLLSYGFPSLYLARDVIPLHVSGYDFDDEYDADLGKLERLMTESDVDLALSLVIFGFHGQMDLPVSFDMSGGPAEDYPIVCLGSLEIEAIKSGRNTLVDYRICPSFSQLLLESGFGS